MKTDVTNYNVEQIEYRNSIKDEKIVLVPRSEIYYNPRNHRCICELEQLATKNSITINMINADIIKYQSLIEEALANSLNPYESERLEKEINEKGQTKPLILTKGNIINNGNSRFMLMNKYFNENPEKYKEFEMIRCIYLPDDFSEDEQEELEITCQIEDDFKIHYNWYGIARWMSDYITNKGFSEEQVRKKFKMKNVKQVRYYIDAYNEGIEYLKYIGKPNHVSIIANDMVALQTIAKYRSRIKDVYKESLAIKLCYGYLASTNKEKGERLYTKLQKIFKYIDDIAEKMLDYKPINEKMNNNAVDKDEMSILDILEECNDEEYNIYKKLLPAFEEVVKKYRSGFINLVNNIIDVEDLKDKNDKSSDVLESILDQACKCIEKAYLLTDVKIHNTKNILLYIDEIREAANKIEEKVQK